MPKVTPLPVSRCRISDRGQELPAKQQSSFPKRKARPRLKGRSRLVEILGRITMAVQVFPFIYTALYIFLFIAYSFTGGTWLDIIDYAAFVSPVVVFAHLVYSRMLMMCRWHRVACALPLFPQAVDLFDVYVYHFDHNAWIAVAVTIIITMILFLVAIYKVFFTDDGRIC